MLNNITSKTGTNNTECYLTPAGDIYETEHNYTLRLEMPGVAKEDLEVTLNNEELEISGKVTNEVPEGKNLRYAEYSLHNYRRKFRIGQEIDRNSISADLENGVLTLTLAKTEAVKPKKIEINVAH